MFREDENVSRYQVGLPTVTKPNSRYINGYRDGRGHNYHWRYNGRALGYFYPDIIMTM